MEKINVHHFETPHPFPSLPRLLYIGMEQRVDVHYRHEGRYRQNEQHLLFQYTVSGEGVFRDGSGEYRIPVGTGFLCDIRDPATAYYYPADEAEPWVFVYMCFMGGNTRQIVHDLLKRFGPIYTLPPETAILQELISMGRREAKRQGLSPVASAEWVMRLFFSLAESRRDHNVPTPAYQLIQRAQRRIQDTLIEPLNVTELAGQLGISREYLTRLFKQQLAISPYRYILRRKMRLAAELLKDTDLTLKQIAPRVGFGSASQFARTFKQVMQLSPGQFRRVGVLPME